MTKSVALMLGVVAGMISISASAAGGDEANPKAGARAGSGAQAYFLQPRDTVLFLGNSITAGAQPELAFLSQDFKQKYPGLTKGTDKVTLVASGIGGELAASGAQRLAALIKQHHPTVCVVCYGTCEVTLKNEKSFTPAMKNIIGQLKAAHVAVTIVSAPPHSPKNWKLAAWPAEQFATGLPEMVAQARALAAEEGVPFVDAFDALTVANKTKGELTSDGIHLNATGYRVMADALQKAWGYGAPLAKPGSPRGMTKDLPQPEPQPSSPEKNAANKASDAPAAP
jgi:lysophospholipase L1-like esterase